MDFNQFKDMKLDPKILESIKPRDLVQNSFQAQRQGEEMQRKINEFTEVMYSKQLKEEEYKEAVLQTLQGIESNTASIVSIIDLLQYNNDKQDEIIILLTDILNVGTAVTQKEAETRYKKALKKINDLGGSVRSIQTLVGVLTTVYNAVIIYIANKP